MFDDTPSYAGQCAYGPSIRIPIEPPRAERLGGFAAVVITAYLDDRDIGGSVRALGFRGPLHTARTDAEAGTGDRRPAAESGARQ